MKRVFNQTNMVPLIAAAIRLMKIGLISMRPSRSVPYAHKMTKLPKNAPITNEIKLRTVTRNVGTHPSTMAPRTSKPDTRRTRSQKKEAC